VTVDEELDQLDNNLRRLKIDYEIYFNGGSKRPPSDTEWRVLSLLRKFSDGSRMNFTQRFRYNSMAQRYAIFSDLWRQKLKIKEEGYRRPQDALLSIQGLRTVEEEPKPEAADTAAKPFTVQCSDVEHEPDKVKTLFKAFVEAKKSAGEKLTGTASLDSFRTFVQQKTQQLRKEYGCHSVEYTVEVQDGQVRLKAKAKV
jgi:hypothetical protein